MQSPLPQLATILLLIHLGFGCCFHHAHACEADCCVAPSATADACPCETHQHDTFANGFANGIGILADGGHEGEQHHCAGEHCTFVASQPAPGQTGEFVPNLITMEVLAADGEADWCRSYLDRTLDRLLPIAGASMRTHLALRVLLV